MDMGNSDFRLDILEIIEGLATSHYPGRLNKVFIVNINLSKITQQV